MEHVTEELASTKKNFWSPWVSWSFVDVPLFLRQEKNFFGKQHDCVRVRDPTSNHDICVVGKFSQNTPAERSIETKTFASVVCR